jgi:hypothetical protein
MSTQPIITDQMKRALQVQAALQPPPVPPLSMGTMQPLPMPAAPQVQNVPNATDNTSRRLLTDQGELRRLQTSGSGIDQITKPIDASGNPTGAPVSGLRRFGGVLARIGDTAATLALGRGAAVIPGTTQRHYALEDRQAGLVNNDLANQKEQAQTQEEQALTNYTLQRPDIEEAKVEQRLNAVKDRVSQAAAARGQTVDWSDPSNPKFQDDVTSQAYADHQALSAMHAATADKSKIMADIAQNHYIPGTPEFEEAQRKLAQVDKRLGVAMASLGLRAQGLQLRKNQQNADFYNVGPNGEVLPGAPQIVDDEGGATTIGRRNASTAIKQNQSVGTFNDLSGSVTHTRDALNQFFTEGGSLSDPRIVAAMSDPNSTIGKVINGKLVQGGLSPNAIEAINAVRQLHEQAGILRKTTGGTASEAGAQRILDVVPSPGDSNAVALQKLQEQERVLERLAPGQTRVTGGLSVQHQGKPQSYKQTASGPGGHKIGSNDGVNWFDVQTGKAVQ